MLDNNLDCLNVCDILSTGNCTFTEGTDMIAVNYSTLRSDMKSYMDKVSDDYETLVVTRKGDGRNIVMISEDTFNNLMENAHLRADSANYDWLIESKRQLAEGKTKQVEVI